MTKTRRHLKRNIDVGEKLIFDEGRLYLKFLGRSAAACAFELKQQDGGVSRRTLHVHERLTLDLGRIVVELERRHGRQARMFVSLDPGVSINRPGAEEDSPAGPDDATPIAGGYV